jgi:hypothetical protein
MEVGNQKQKKKMGVTMEDCTFITDKQNCSVLKVARWYPLVLLVKPLRQGSAGKWTVTLI